MGLGLHEFAAGVGNRFDCALRDLELLGLDDVVELWEGQAVVVAQVEGGDGWVEQILQQVVGEGWLLGLVVLVCWFWCRFWFWFGLCVDHHAGIVACRRSGTRGERGRSMVLRTGVVVGGIFAHRCGS